MSTPITTPIVLGRRGRSTPYCVTIANADAQIVAQIYTGTENGADTKFRCISADASAAGAPLLDRDATYIVTVDRYQPTAIGDDWLSPRALIGTGADVLAMLHSLVGAFVAGTQDKYLTSSQCYAKLAAAPTLLAAA